MPPFAIGLVVVVFLVLLSNVVALIFRMRKLRSPYGRRGKKAQSEDLAAIARDNEIYRRLELEQARIEKYLKLRAQTWELYDEVRQKYESL